MFGVLHQKRLSVIGVEEFDEARPNLNRRGAMASVALHINFSKRVKARLMPSAMAYAANSGTSPGR